MAKSYLTEGSDIALLRLEKPLNLTEYVHTICLPSTKWVPENSECFIHGHHNGVFNHAIETTLKRECNQQDDGSFDLCTRQDTPTDECLNNWSGTLVCPDATGKLYSVGLYHSGPGQCENGQNNGAEIPNVFVEIVSDEARQVIIDVMAPAEETIEPISDDTCSRDEGLFRCPLGNCLIKDEVKDFRFLILVEFYIS